MVIFEDVLFAFVRDSINSDMSFIRSIVLYFKEVSITLDRDVIRELFRKTITFIKKY